MEFAGPGVANLSADFHVESMLQLLDYLLPFSIWQTDEKIQEFYEIHGRAQSYKELKPGDVAYYFGCVTPWRDQANDRYAVPSKQYLYN